jgi:hypothetical protein
MRKAYSTKIVRPVPVEFEQNFVTLGWCVVNHMYGKRAAQRYFIACGPGRLRKLRDAFLAQQRVMAANKPLMAA